MATLSPCLTLSLISVLSLWAGPGDGTSGAGIQSVCAPPPPASGPGVGAGVGVGAAWTGPDGVETIVCRQDHTNCLVLRMERLRLASLCRRRRTSDTFIKAVFTAVLLGTRPPPFPITSPSLPLSPLPPFTQARGMYTLSALNFSAIGGQSSLSGARA